MLFESLGAKKTTSPEDQPVVQSMRASAQGIPKNPTREDKKVRQQLARTSSLDIADDHDLRPLHTRAAARFTPALSEKDDPPMNREAQILQALANSSLSMEARRALTDELHDVRAEAARRHEASRSIDFDAASAHLTPVQPHVHHTAETDWLGRVAAHGKTAQQIHAAAKAEASRWFTTIHPQIVADRTEFAIQATGKAHQWAGQWGDDFRSAVASFLQQAGHLAGFKVAECDDESGDDGEDGDSNGDAEKSNPPMSGEDGEVEDDDDYDGPRKESIRRRVGSMEDLPVYRFTANPSQYTPEDLAIALRDGYDDLGRGTDTDPDGNPYVWVEYRMDDSTARSWYDTIPGIGMSRRGVRRSTAVSQEVAAASDRKSVV